HATFRRLRRPPTATPFPYTTLFRSARLIADGAVHRVIEQQQLLHGRPRLRHVLGGLALHLHALREGLLARRHELRLLRLDVLARSEEHTSELQSRENLVCRLLLEKK